MARIAIVASDDDPRQLAEKGGSLLAQISNAFVTMQKDYWGIGPLEAKSYMMDDLLLIVMRGGMTRAERTMLDFGQQDLVRSFRQAFENEMTQKLTGKIEELTGRRVLTYQSQILFDPDIVAELFVFDRVAGGGAAEIVATAEGQLRQRPHGRIQDETGASTDEAPPGAADAPSELR
jgi:uncharacterized protein YbcI